jgi:hypothetical protein
MRLSRIALLVAFLLPANRGAAQSQVPPYDPATAINLSGTVEDIRDVTDPPAAKGVHLIVRTSEATFDVLLGPADFVRDFEAAYTKASQIDVKGWKVKFGAATVIVAREIRKADITLALRDRQGRPLWVPLTGKS